MRPLQIVLLLILIISVLFTRLWQLDNPDPSTDELSYINEGYLLQEKDPQIVPRHHMFQHPAPNFPHPFLVGRIVSYSFELFGHSLYAARLPIALFSIFTVIIVAYFAYDLTKKHSVAYVAALFSIFLPLNVRYARESYLDAALAFFVVCSTFLWWRFLQSRKISYACLAGCTVALALSTKITGLALIPALLLTGIVFLRQSPLSVRKTFVPISLFIASFAIVFFLLNSPSAYLNGLLHHPNTGIDDWGINSIISGFISPQYWNYWSYMLIYNFTLPIFLLSAFSLIVLYRKHLSNTGIMFMLIFTVIYASFSITTHLPSSISGPWAYQPEMNLVIILSAIALMLIKKHRYKIIIITLATLIPMSIYHGFRLNYDPYITYHNVRFEEQYMQDAVKELNHLAEGSDEYFIHISAEASDVPVWLLNSNINYRPWTHTQQLDAIITDKLETINTLSSDYEVHKEYPYGRLPHLFIFQRKNSI